jgi:predicted NBD/HSP70 family sugar kinase
VRGIDLSGSKVRNVRAHLANKLIRNNRITQSPHEQSRTLDLDAILNLQQRLVGFEVGLAVAVIVACDMSAVGLRKRGTQVPGLIRERNSQGPARPCLEYSST